MSKFYHVQIYKSTFLGTWTLLNVYSVFIFCTHTVLCVDFTSLYDYSVPVVSWLLEYFSCRQISVIKSFTPPPKKNTSYVYIYIENIFPSTKTFRWIMFLESNKNPFSFGTDVFWSICKLCAGQMLTFLASLKGAKGLAFAPTKAIFTFLEPFHWVQLKWRPPRPILILPVFCYSDLAYGDCFFWWMKDGMKMFLLVLAVAENDTDWLQNKEMIYPPLVVVAWWSIQQFFGQKGL